MRKKTDVLSTFPPRSLATEEYALFLEWLGRAGDVPLAYLSRRRSDDPAFYQRIVICTGPADQPSHLIHAPEGATSWIVTLMDQPQTAREFETLKAALNSVRPVLKQ